jgi:hypothetical protein
LRHFTAASENGWRRHIKNDTIAGVPHTTLKCYR